MAIVRFFFLSPLIRPTSYPLVYNKRASQPASRARETHQLNFFSSSSSCYAKGDSISLLPVRYRFYDAGLQGLYYRTIGTVCPELLLDRRERRERMRRSTKEYKRSAKKEEKEGETVESSQQRKLCATHSNIRTVQYVVLCTQSSSSNWGPVFSSRPVGTETPGFSPLFQHL